MTNEWILAIVICVTPFLLLAMFEAIGWMRSRRDRAIARRSKSATARRGSSGIV